MASSNEAPLDFTINTANTSTLVPMAAEGTMCTWKLSKLNQATNDKGRLLKFEFELVNPTTTTEGKPLNPGEIGSRFFDQVTLYDKNTPAGEIPEWANQKICKYQDALLGTGDPGNAKGKPARPDLSADTVQVMLGKTLVAKMKVGKSQDGSPRSEFGQLFFPADIAA